MKILVLGATGMIGSRIVSEAASRGHTILAASRKGDAAAQDAVTPVALDINDASALAEQASQVDLVISAVSPRNGGNQTEEAVAFTKSLIAAVGDTRLIQVGGAGSLLFTDGTPVHEKLPEQYASEAAAMLAAYNLLAASDIDWTVQAPAMMISPGERTGNVRVGDRTLVTDGEGNSAISAEDFASVLVDEAEHAQHRKQIFNAAY